MGPESPEDPSVVVSKTTTASVVIYSAKWSVDELAAEFPDADSAWASQRRRKPGTDSQGRSRLRSGVRFDSRCPGHAPVGDHIRDALDRVAPIAAQLEQHLGSDEHADHWGTLSVHLQTDGIAGGVSVSPDELRELERLRLRLDITVSFIGD